MLGKGIVVISHFGARDPASLINLVSSLKPLLLDLVVVINCDNGGVTIDIPGVKKSLLNENSGMNVGA
jgi:hypothetical protein